MFIITVSNVIIEIIMKIMITSQALEDKGQSSQNPLEGPVYGVDDEEGDGVGEDVEKSKWDGGWKVDGFKEVQIIQSHL